MSDDKNLCIESTKRRIGWIYNKIKKLSDDEIKKANLKRKEFFEFFDENHVNCALNNLSKPHLGNLSPGCWTCIEGTWSCFFINGLCTKSCFFCPQNREMKKERESFTLEKTSISSIDEYISYLKKFNFKGIGISGGEPFLVFDKLVEYIKKIRQVFGLKYYIWVYTNGDLVTEEKLELLKKAGLDEIRFNIFPRNYDLEPIRLAVRYINTVTVEIPAIPEDVEKVKSILKKIEEIGVKYLNLHQLNITEYNYESFIKRNYTLLHTTNPAILESEFAAFEIIKHGINIKSKLGINYCSSCYKQRFQSQGHRKRYAPLCQEKFDQITKTGFIRNLSIDILEDRVEILDIFEKFPNRLWEVERDRILFDKDLLVKLKNSNKKIRVVYYFPIPTYPKGKKEYLKNTELLNENSIFLFQKLFIENKSPEKIIDELSEEYELDKKEKMVILKDTKSFYDEFADLEYISKNVPEYY